PFNEREAPGKQLNPGHILDKAAFLAGMCRAKCKGGLRVFDFQQPVSSLIEVRQLHEQYTEQWHSYVISDQPAMLYQATYERYDATLTIETRNIAEHRKQFKQMWQRSDIATQLRRQML
ncbi:MAG: hypothetical protein COC05_04725, partial [Gammaproteobacteria bacterium]